MRDRWIAGLLAVWSLGWFLVIQRRGGGSWHFFLDGASALGHVHDSVRGGLHVYAGAPVEQIGPVALLGVLALLPAGGGLALAGWEVLGTACGAFLLWYVRRLALRERPNLDVDAVNLRIGIAGFFFMPAWIWLAVGDAHVDDVLALTFAVLALGAAREGRAWLCGVFFGLAVDSKPWAVAFGAILFVLADRVGWRGREGLGAVLRAGLAAAGVVLVAWAPFFLADSGTINLMHFTIPNTPLTALRVLGVDDARTPSWDRPAQMVLAFGLGIGALRRGRWAAIVLLAMAARLVLDPGTFIYYAAGPMLGAVIWDVVGRRTWVPWWTIGTFVALFASRGIPMPAPVHGCITLAFFLACCGILVAPGSDAQHRTGGAHRRVSADRTERRTVEAPLLQRGRAAVL
jgi:hypothetical protein